MTEKDAEFHVAKDIAARQAVGLAKYGVSLANAGYSSLELLVHAYQEALDLAIYLKTEIRKREARMSSLKGHLEEGGSVRLHQDARHQWPLRWAIHLR